MSRHTQRLALRTGLVLILLSLGSSRADSFVLTGEVRGVDVTREGAQAAALQQARERITTLLRDRRPGALWSPPDEYLLENHLVETVHTEKLPSEYFKEVHAVLLRLRVRQEDLTRMLQLDNQDSESRRRASLHERHLLTVKVLAALTALLAALAGFFRLEEATRGYYTNPLRVALAVCIALIGAGLWLFW